MHRKKRAADFPFRIRRVIVTGNTRTKDDILRLCLAPISSASTWEEINHRLQEAALSLERLGTFKSVRLLLDDAPEAGAPEVDACDLRVRDL